jgi:hypothetical protein
LFIADKQENVFMEFSPFQKCTVMVSIISLNCSVMFHWNVVPSVVLYLLFYYTYKVQNRRRHNRAKMDLTVAVQFDGSWLIIIIIKPINEEKYSIKPSF